MNVSVYLLDWNQRRPWIVGSNPNATQEVLQAFRSGRYEYSFTLSVGVDPRRAEDSSLCESAYFAQGNNPTASKIRQDRQSMSEGDICGVDGRAYVCAAFGFLRVTGLDHELERRITQSWERWTDETQNVPDCNLPANVGSDDCPLEHCRTHGSARDR